MSRKRRELLNMMNLPPIHCREKELEIIDMVRKTICDDEICESILERLDSAPSSFHLNLTGAQFDAMARLRASAGGNKLEMRDLSQEMKILIIAGIFRSSHRACVHALHDVAVFKTCVLAPRVLFCESCMPKFAPILIEHDNKIRQGKAVDKNECDFCLGHADHFYEFCTAHNGCVVHGDMCERCKELSGMEP